MKKWTWKHLILFILAIPVLNHMAGYLGRSTAQHVNEREAASAPQSGLNQRIKVVASSQDSDGLTQKNFDLNFLKSLEAYTVERVKMKTNEYLSSQGLPSTNVDFISEANYVESGSIKLGVIRLRTSEGSIGVFIVGILGNELKRVGCVRDSTETIPISYGVCADKIKEVFGIKMED